MPKRLSEKDRLCRCGKERKIYFWKGLNKGRMVTCGEKECDNLATLNHKWKGGKTIDKDGYVLILDRNHLNINKKGISRYRREHVVVMEKYLGRKLNQKEVIHHKDGNRQNNQIENLELFATNGEHLKFELTNRPYRQGWLTRKEQYA